MKIAKRAIFSVSSLVIASSGVWGQTPAKRPMTFNDLVAMHRVSDPQASPDGNWVAYVVATPDLGANRMLSNIWIVPGRGGVARQLTRGDSDTRPRWSPDSQKLAFLSSRDGTAQVYWISLYGGEASRLTFLSTGADNELWSPDGKWIAFTSRVYPDCRDDACNRQRDAAKEKNRVKARIYERLLFRHWTEWWDGKRSHLFVIPASGGAPRDLTLAADYDVPPFNLGAPEAIAFSPDSKELCFTANIEKDEALSTNGDLFTVPVSGDASPRRITTNPADDWGPAYSSDGRWIAYRAQKIPGYESDRWRLMLYERSSGRHETLMENFDRWVDSYAWAPGSKTIYFTAEDRAEEPLYSISIAAGSSPKTILSASFNPEFSITADGKRIFFTRTSLAMPAEVFAADTDGGNVQQITHQNESLLALLDLPSAEPFWFAGAGGTQVEGMLLRPPHFDPAKRYPLVLLVHGGPQGAWDDEWGYRWNPELFAAPGYVVVMINPRGSTGYGQRFVDEIQGDWGGKVYEDLMKGANYALANFPFIDASRAAAAGGSFGGYMVDWFATHTGRFKCLISHAGPYDLTSMYGSTEELWFVEHDLEGTPWSHPEMYAKWSPSTYAGELGKFKTPTLVIGGERDFRVPYTQDLEFFTALQRQQVPSKLMIFPDEGHFILKPQNSAFWYRLFLGWLAEYLK